MAVWLVIAMAVATFLYLLRFTAQFASEPVLQRPSSSEDFHEIGFART